MDPATIALLAKLGVTLLTTPNAPSAAELAAAQARAAAEARQKWIIGGALGAGAILLYLVATRR